MKNFGIDLWILKSDNQDCEMFQTGQDSIEAETQRILDNIEAILMEARFSIRDVVKTTVYATDINDFAAINGVYAKTFKVDPPARSFVQVAALPKGARVVSG